MKISPQSRPVITSPSVESAVVPAQLPSIADAGTVLIGGQSPMFPPAAVRDFGRVKIGGQSPSF